MSPLVDLKRNMVQFLSFACLLLAAKSVSAVCSRDVLKAATSQYVAAQSNGHTSFEALADNAAYLENDNPTDIKKSVLVVPMKIDHNRSFHDTVDCSALTELVVTDPKAPYVIHTRMLLNVTTSKISFMESVVTQPGDWAFNATGYLYWNSLETWEPIPKEKRDPRAIIQAAGDAYFNRFNNASVVIPLGTPCARLEGGAYTGRGNLSANTCDIGGFPSTIEVTNRRYIIDEEMGVVDIFEGFPGLDRAFPKTPAPDSHLFRIEGGKIRYCHTVSHCIAPHCGMNGTGFGKRDD